LAQGHLDPETSLLDQVSLQRQFHDLHFSASLSRAMGCLSARAPWNAGSQGEPREHGTEKGTHDVH